MAKKGKKKRVGVVYSTNENFEYSFASEIKLNTADPSDQRLRIHLDRLGGGKLLTRIEGFAGSEDDMDTLASKLKKHCGVGGTSKEGVILIQGDHRDKVLKYLVKKGYQDTKKAGG